LNQLLRELQENGMLVSSGGDYPMITLTARGELVMKGATDYALRWPQRSAAPEAGRARKKKTAAVGEMVPFDEALFDRLKKVRLELARRNGNLPAYMIFSDETLRAFARLKPVSVEAGRKIRGVGDLKAERYLPSFITAIWNSSEAESTR
jgi:ATP-dependent DNA helicase RecQ